MEHLIVRACIQAVPKTSRCAVSNAPRSWNNVYLTKNPTTLVQSSIRAYATNPPRSSDHPPHHSDKVEESSHAQPAHKLSQNVTTEETNHYDKVLAHSKEQQVRSPWTRVDSDMPPVDRQRSAGAMVKGKLLTTPSRMLKLILPLSTKDTNSDRKDVEPLALLVHPQQPLSYLERLIQAELPSITNEGGREKTPAIIFRAEDPAEEDEGAGDAKAQKKHEIDDGDNVMVDGKMEKTGVIRKNKQDSSETLDIKAKDPKHPNFVRWSPSTEIGDFIRDASRGKEFSVEIEGSHEPIYVGVPSFQDRTYYLRMRLRKVAKRIASMADVKQECDDLAQRGAKRVAQAGFGVLISWWYIVYRLTFETDLGWDVMEPVTYLVGLSTLIGGYMWFLYHNREVSYRSAMNFTVSRRQSKLYDQKGLDLPLWEGLVEEGNRLRREIKLVAEEYDVEWNEKEEAGDGKVAEALREERKKKQKQRDEDDDGGNKKKDDDD